VLVQVQTRIDKKPDARTIQADIRRIYAMDIFDDVVVASRPGKNDSLVIIFQLKEKPAVDEVLFEGNKDISKEDIGEVVDIKTNQVLDVAKVKANVGKIQKLYVDKGYFLASVSYEIRKSTGTRRPRKRGCSTCSRKTRPQSRQRCPRRCPRRRRRRQTSPKASSSTSSSSSKSRPR